MRKFVMALAMVLTAMCATAAAETVTGVVERSEYGGEVFYRLYDSGMGFLVGCGADSGLSADMREYLAKNVGQPAEVEGTVIDSPTWGFCVDVPELPGAEPEAEEARATMTSKLAEHDWLKLPDGLSADETEIVEMVFTDSYWDPALRAPIRSFLGFCRYFHERGFSIKVEYDRVREKAPTKSGDMHYVTVKMVNVAEGKAMEVPLMALSSQHMINAMRKKNGESARRARAIVLFKYVLIADSYVKDRWLHMDGAGWLNLIRAVITEGYAEEG
jgi:hypothetical protein